MAPTLAPLVVETDAEIIFTASNGFVVTQHGLYVNSGGDLAVDAGERLFVALMELLAEDTTTNLPRAAHGYRLNDYGIKPDRQFADYILTPDNAIWVAMAEYVDSLRRPNE